MGFFNDIGKKTTEATSKITKEAKLKLKMGDNKNKINNLYQEIGKKVYEKHARGENVGINEELNEEFEKIDSLSSEIEEARLEILKLNNKKICSNCYSEVDTSSSFCPKCGEKLQNEEVVAKVPETVEDAEIVAEEVKEEIVKEDKEENE